MSFGIILIGGWVLATGVVGVFAWSLGRAAAIGDRQQHGVEARALVVDRRRGSPDRRDRARRRLGGSPGRRAEDLLGRDVATADLSLGEGHAPDAREEGRRIRRTG